MSNGIILLVDDNADDVELALRAVKAHGIANRVEVARDGVEACDYLFSTGPHAGKVTEIPTVMLLDLNMPRVDGFEVLRRVRGHPQIGLLPVVVLTSSDEERDLIESYSLGCNGYVRKPVGVPEFSAAVRQLGLYWLLLNKGPPLA